MNDEEKRQFLAEVRRREAERVQAAKQAFPVPEGVPPLGSFYEDDPEVHFSFQDSPPEEA
jgi:hypothetical protein